MEKLLRRQHHDYLNHIQVVYAYLQAGKSERAIAYIEKIISEDKAAFAGLLSKLSEERKI
jgi:sensor histidine kinase regulating citrate/malate metabolism